MKKLFSLLFSFLFILLAVANQPSDTAIAATTLGDCNGSGSLTVSDITTARGHLYDNDGSYPLACDANKDGGMTSADLHCIRRLIDGQACAPQNWDARIGTNLNGLVDFSPEYTFVNAFKSSRFWTKRIDWGTWGDNLPDNLDLDDDGYPRSLPDPNGNPPYRYLATFLFKDIGDAYPGGTYHLFFDGTGTLGYGGDATANWGASSQGHHVLNVVPNVGIEITISATDLGGTGDYIRNMRLIHDDFVQAGLEDELFHPDFLDSIAPFKTLRFMDWMRTNHEKMGARSDDAILVELIDEEGSPEPYAKLLNGHVLNTSPPTGPRAVTTVAKPSDAHYTTDKGAPVEVMVALANEANIDPWFNMSHLATDAYVTDFATYVRDNLEPTQRVYVEYSNEIWNSIFEQGDWIKQQGVDEWPDAPDTEFNQRRQLNWYGKRTHQICEIWEQVFGADSERIVCLINMQASNTGGAAWLADQILDCTFWAQGPCDTYVDAIAIAPYIGNHLASGSAGTEIRNWINDPAIDEMDRLFTELLDGGPIDSDSSVSKAIHNMDVYGGVANALGLELISYEGGQHLNHTFPDVNALFNAASNHADMQDVYDAFLEGWRPTNEGAATAQDGKLFLHFNNTSKYGASGAWGSQEEYDDLTRPKLESLLAYNSQVGTPNTARCDWDDCTGVPTVVSAEISIPTQAAVAGNNSFPIQLDTNAHAVSELAFALAYDDSKLTFNSVALVGGLSAEFAYNVTQSSGLVRVSVYPKTATATTLPDGDILSATFTQTGSSSGQGVRFVSEQSGGGAAALPATCGNDFGQPLACNASGTTLTSTAPTAITLKQPSSSTASTAMMILLGIALPLLLTLTNRLKRNFS